MFTGIWRFGESDSDKRGDEGMRRGDSEAGCQEGMERETRGTVKRRDRDTGGGRRRARQDGITGKAERQGDENAGESSGTSTRATGCYDQIISPEDNSRRCLYKK